MKKGKAYLGILIALVMAALLVLPTTATESAEEDAVPESAEADTAPESAEADNAPEGEEPDTAPESGTTGTMEAEEIEPEDPDDTGDTGNPGEPTDPLPDTSDWNGFHQDPDSGDVYYYKDGEIDTSVTDVKKGTLDGVSGWWNIVNGEVIRSETVAKNDKGWWYIDANGMVDFSYNGFAENEYGSWYCEDGKVTFATQDILKDTTGAIGETGDWWYVIGSKVQTDYTGLSNFRNAYGWWYIENGKVDFSHNGVDKNINGWWYVTDGKVQFGFTGLANYKNENGWWYIKNGKVDFSHSGIDENVNGWWYILGGKVDFTHNGVDKNQNGWWYLTGGKVDFSYTGVADYQNEYGWWYIKEGKVDFSFNGISDNKNGFWYVKGGKVDFSYSGDYQENGVRYVVLNGKADFADVMVLNSTFTGDLLDRLCVRKGTLLSRTLTEREFDQIINEFMKSSYVTNVSYRLITDAYVWNGGPRWDCSSTSLYLLNYYLLTYDEAYQAAKKENPFASSSELITTALAAVGQMAEGAYPESGSLYMVNAASQAASWGNPVYTYKDIGNLTASNPGNLRYGDLLFYGYNNGSSVTITHVAVYLGQFYLANGDTGYYQLENTSYAYGGITEGRADGVRISPFRTKGTSSTLVHAARIF